MIHANVRLSTIEEQGPARVLAESAVPLLAAVFSTIVALILAALVRVGLRAAGRRWPLLSSLSDRTRWPVRMLLVSIGVWLGLLMTTDPSPWRDAVNHALLITVILASAWLLIQVTHVVQDGVGARFPIDVPDNRNARRVHTQVQLLGRLVVAIIVVAAAAAVLITFPGLRAVGASVLASAGLAAIVAGFAAQSSLANLFAGIQVAFADAIRVDDVVVVEGEWGRIEEITLTYVVVHVWDDRRLVLPSTYFTSTPFENWTRTSSELLGTVDLDVDWTVPMGGLRGEMHRLLSHTELWDRRVAVLQVTEATGGMIRVRALASASSAPILWDLRCYLREGLVMWLQQAGSGLPRSRFEAVDSEGLAEMPTPGKETTAAPSLATAASQPSDDVRPSAEETGLFTGSIKAVLRSQPFSGPDHDVSDERNASGDKRPTRP